MLSTYTVKKQNRFATTICRLKFSLHGVNNYIKMRSSRELHHKRIEVTINQKPMVIMLVHCHLLLLLYCPVHLISLTHFVGIAYTCSALRRSFYQGLSSMLIL